MVGMLAFLAQAGENNNGEGVDVTSILGYIVVGAIVGVLARFLVPGDDPMGIVATILLGIVGRRDRWMARRGDLRGHERRRLDRFGRRGGDPGALGTAPWPVTAGVASTPDTRDLKRQRCIAGRPGVRPRPSARARGRG